MKLNKGILDKLENEGYITRERIGKNNTIRITESGKYIAYLSGTL
jgi:DNA-binding PadR family transcriptional regulator